MMNVRFRQQTNTWPGFVDLFSNLVIILIFLLIVFVFLWTTTSVFNKKTGAKTIAELKAANAEQEQTIQQLTESEQEAKGILIRARAELLNLENDKAELNNEIQEMDMSINDLVGAYESTVNKLQDQLKELNAQVGTLTADRDAAARANAELTAATTAQINALRQELERLNAALDAANTRADAQQIQYVEMSTRLNKALADKVAELKNVSQFQSEFYRAIKTALGDRTTIRNDGDRFIVSSDILFNSGSYTLSPAGREQLRVIGGVIKDLEEKIPSDINWIIRVDGHTDNKPVIAGTRPYRDNMQLSLLRATAVVDALANAGVSRRRLVPSGFGDLHPVELGSDAASLQKNRRIELQLTNR